MAKEKRPPLRALAALIRSRTARALPRATPYPLVYAWEPPSPRIRCLLACFTYLLTLGFARGRRSGGPGRTGARAPGAPLRSSAARAMLTSTWLVGRGTSAGHIPQEARLIHNRELPGVPAVGGSRALRVR